MSMKMYVIIVEISSILFQFKYVFLPLLPQVNYTVSVEIGDSAPYV